MFWRHVHPSGKGVSSAVSPVRGCFSPLLPSRPRQRACPVAPVGTWVPRRLNAKRLFLIPVRLRALRWRARLFTSPGFRARGARLGVRGLAVITAGSGPGPPKGRGRHAEASKPPPPPSSPWRPDKVVVVARPLFLGQPCPSPHPLPRVGGSSTLGSAMSDSESSRPPAAKLRFLRSPVAHRGDGDDDGDDQGPKAAPGDRLPDFVRVRLPAH